MPDTDGNTRETATRIVPGEDRAAELADGDTDYFRIPVDRAGTLLVYTSGTTDTTGFLAQADGTGLINRFDGGDGDNFRIEIHVSAGTYYAQVTIGRDAVPGPYTLHVRLVPDDHGNERTSATRIDPGRDRPGELSARDVDYFQVTVDRAGILVAYSSGSADTAARLEDAGGTALARDDDEGTDLNFRIEQVVPAGTYYVRVHGDGDIRAGRYTVHVRFEPDADGDTRGTATRVAPGEDRAAGLTPGDEDWFQITLNQPGSLLVYTSGSLSTVGHLTNAGGIELAMDEDGGHPTSTSESSAASPPARTTSGWQAPAPFGVGRYTLHVRFAAGDGHGDTRHTATPIVVGPSTSIEVTQAGELTAGDTDWFDVIVEQPRNVAGLHERRHRYPRQHGAQPRNDL